MYDNMRELPRDNMYDILSRIPLKSLARFQCVSKLWCNYINDPYLEIMHAKRAIKEPAMLFMFNFHRHNCPDGWSCTLRMLETKEEVGSSQVVISKKPPTMGFSCKHWGSRFIIADIILGSCNGLVYSSQDHPDGGITLVVINPLKKQCFYKLPPIKIWLCTSWFDERESCGLGFDDSTNTFKMVCVVIRKQVMSPDVDVLKRDLCTMVHVLGTDSWRQISQVPSFPIKGEGIFLDGCLHWLVSDVKYLSYYLAKKVITFDIRKEEFGLINSPKNESMPYIDERLVDLDGQLGFVFNDAMLGCSIEVWLLKQKEWVMHCRFDYKPPLPSNCDVKVLGFWNKDGDLLLVNRSRKKLFVYSLKSNVIHETKFPYRGNGYQTDIRMYRSTMSSIRHPVKR